MHFIINTEFRTSYVNMKYKQDALANTVKYLLRRFELSKSKYNFKSRSQGK